MGFLDKVKAQGSALAEKAQEGLNQGQSKLNDAQASRKANDLLGQLGTWEWVVRNGRDDGRATQELERIQGELAAHEAEHGPIQAPQPAPVAAPPAPPGADQAGSPPPPPGGAAPAPPAPQAPGQPAAPPPPTGIAPPPPPTD